MEYGSGRPTSWCLSFWDGWEVFQIRTFNAGNATIEELPKKCRHARRSKDVSIDKQQKHRIMTGQSLLISNNQ